MHQDDRWSSIFRLRIYIDVGRNRLREAFQDFIVAASIAHHDCRRETAFDEA
jgi:hypothetical protein